MCDKPATVEAWRPAALVILMHFRPISLVCTAKASATHRADRLAHENGRRAWQNRCTDDGSAQVQTTSSPANRRYFGAREMTWRSIAHFSCNGRRRRLPSLVRSAPRVPPSSAGAPRSTNTQAAARPRPGMHSGTQSRNKEPTMISAPPAASGAALKQARAQPVHGSLKSPELTILFTMFARRHPALMFSAFCVFMVSLISCLHKKMKPQISLPNHPPPTQATYRTATYSARRSGGCGKP